MLVKPVESVIWDFNGTLLDDLDLVVRTVNGQLEKRGLPPLTAEGYRDVFGFPVEDYYRRIGLDFETESMADLAADFFADYEPQLRNCELHEGAFGRARSSLSVRRQAVCPLGDGGGDAQQHARDSGNPKRFVAAYGLAHQEGDSKVSRGGDLLAYFGIGRATALLVGDTDHDAEVASALGVPVALVEIGRAHV